MNFMKFKQITFAILALLVIQSCDNTDAYFGAENGSGVTLPEEFSRLSDLIKPEMIPADTILFNPTVIDTIIGSFGTKIFMPASACTGSGGAVFTEDSAYVVLREFPTLGKMILGNVQTESNQEMLVTGGNFWWKIIDSDGNELGLVQPSQVTAEQPISLDMGTYASSAQYFEGTEISGGEQQVINWTAIESESNMDEQNDIFNYYGLNLYWVNCDAFYNYTDRTQFAVSLNSNNTIAAEDEMVVLIPDNFPSVINIYNRSGDFFVTHANSIPVGLTGTLLAIALDENDTLLIGSTQVTVAGDDEFTIDLTEGTVAELQALVSQVTQ